MRRLLDSRPLRALLLAGVALGAVRTVAAHPAPFSYVDLDIRPATIHATLVVHVYDLAHELPASDDLDVDAASWLDPTVLAARGREAIALLQSRFHLEVDGQVPVGRWLDPVPSDATDAVLFEVRYPLTAPAGGLRLETWLFPYDPLHQTFINVYDESRLVGQAVLSGSRREFAYEPGDPPGAWDAVVRFLPSGIHHILIGPDHLLFLVGLLLMGGTITRLAWVVSAFTVAHSLTLSLAALGLVLPPAGLIEPAIALSIVYVGIDNLLVGQGRDTRTWIAFAFGLIHGFGFANVLREMALPPGALVSSLLSFNVGVEIGQLVVVVVVVGALSAVRRARPGLGRLVVQAGSAVVLAAGSWWFIERVFL